MMNLESDRLYLKILTQDDSGSYYLLSQNDGFRQFQISDYRKKSQEDTSHWITQLESYHKRNGLGIVGVFEKNCQTLVGLGALKYLEEEQRSPIELMYRISDKFWGKGYGFEIASTLVCYAFENLNLEHLVATVDPKNIPSKKILLKLGFQFERMIQVESYDEELYKLMGIRKKHGAVKTRQKKSPRFL